ncbi:hypothetical protein [uncultured Ornithinimicrobium sp.]|uniref:hypothetical protein n=1 Tax=uncultured Ornithinimicrobium sp. TaxID=259307 RepID=UPI002597B6E2|nr:hypothetical protein [uncultured Ornithinimicrobium sp.]
MTGVLGVLHALAVLRFAEVGQVVRRAEEPRQDVLAHLGLAAEEGWAEQLVLGDERGWCLTPAGRSVLQGALAAELDALPEQDPDLRAQVLDMEDALRPCDATVSSALGRWRLGRLGAAPPVAPAEVLQELSGPGALLEAFEHWCREVGITRLLGYRARFGAALGRAAVDPAWIADDDRDSCEQVWRELVEDLCLTAGVPGPRPPSEGTAFEP